MSKFKMKVKKWKGAKKTAPKAIKNSMLPKGKGDAEPLKQPGVKSGYKTEKKKDVKGVKNPEKTPEKKKSLDESINTDMDKFNNLVKRLDEEFAKELEANDDLADLANAGEQEDEIGAEENDVTITLKPDQIAILRAILAQVDGEEAGEAEGEEAGEGEEGDEHAEPDADNFGGPSDNDADNVSDEDEEMCCSPKPVAKVTQGKAIPQKTTHVKPQGNQGLKKEPFKTSTNVKAPKK